ncbi:MAG: pilus assembly protein PilZ [Methylocystis sp.]|nr:MAG: pilus assembly protein PilZ [Methylocystis sp.]
MSTGEMVIASDVRPVLDDQVIVYIAELGRFEGKVARHEPAGYAVAMSLAPLKHAKLAEQLVWFANRSTLDLSDNRRHKRFVPLTQLTTVRLSNGKERMARINDISASGVNVEVNVSVSKLTILVGSQVVVGSKSAKVIRVYDGGFVAKFDEDFAEGAIDETITL